MTNDILTGKTCPYCGAPSVLTDSIEIYGVSYGMIYLCRPCDAYCGTHKSDQTTALGRLANKELRFWKKQAHAAFDPLWKSGLMQRNDAYTWLSQKMETERDLTHIGMFDVDQCKRVVELSHKKLKSCSL